MSEWLYLLVAGGCLARLGSGKVASEGTRWLFVIFKIKKKNYLLIYFF